MLDACALRCWAWMISMSDCLTSDFVSKRVIFRSGAEVQRPSVPGRFCAKLSSMAVVVGAPMQGESSLTWGS